MPKIPCGSSTLREEYQFLMTTDNILTLAFGIPFFLILGAAAGLVVAALFGVDFTNRK